MAFPSIESVTANNATGGAATSGSTAGTSHTVVMPATVSPGALLIVVGRVAVAGTVAVTGGGWTIVQDSSDGSDDVSFWMYKNTLAVGNEDSTGITVTHGNGKMCCGAMSIIGAADPAINPPTTSTVAVGTGSNPGPTTCTPTSGAKDYLWIAVGMADGEHTSPPTTIPASYGASSGWSTGTASAAGNNCTTFTATRNLNATSEDAGTWTTSVAVNTGWTSWTIVIHPNATRLYFRRALQGSGADIVADAAWEDTGSFFPSFPMLTTPLKDLPPVDSMVTVNFTDADDTNRDCVMRQYYTYPLAAGQTVTGSQAIRAQIRCSQVNATNNMFLTIGIRVISAAAAVQKVVLAVTRDDVAAATSLTNRRFTATSAATNYTTVAGDRLVIEVGLGGDPAAASDHDSSIRVGDAAASDLPEDDVSTSDLRPWIELTDVLTFIPTILEDEGLLLGQQWQNGINVTVFN